MVLHQRHQFAPADEKECGPESDHAYAAQGASQSVGADARRAVAVHEIAGNHEEYRHGSAGQREKCVGIGPGHMEYDDEEGAEGLEDVDRVVALHTDEVG